MTGTIEPLVESAFPSLSSAERESLIPLARVEQFSDGDYLFRAGDAAIDLFVVQRGEIEIRNPIDDNRVVATHPVGEFTGDIDLLTGRPVIVDAVAVGDTTVLRIPNEQIRGLLQRIPSLSEKLIIAFTRRRELLIQSGRSGLQIIGSTQCKDTVRVREFLYKNFVPFNWIDSNEDRGKELLGELGRPDKLPVILCGDGTKLVSPSLSQLASCAKVWKPCHDDSVDLAIVGAGPAGLTTAVYAASEGLSTLLMDRMGPGGQAASSSRIENFIGFPAGLSGTELAMRGVIQLLKFGAKLAAPVVVNSLAATDGPDSPIELRTDEGVTITAQVVLISTGVCWRRLDVPNAQRFEGVGIHYVCTVVEAFLYDDRDVAVIGGGNSAGQAAMFLAECCRGRKVHIILRHELDVAMSKYLHSRIRCTANIVIHENSEVTRVDGDTHLETLDITTRGSATGETFTGETLQCRGAFVFIGAEPASGFLPPEVARDERGYILTGIDAMKSNGWPLSTRDPCALETTLPRVLAAGDIRSGSTRRVGIAVGDGSLAVSCAHRLISQLP